MPDGHLGKNLGSFPPVLPLNKIDSKAAFIVLVPHTVVLSEHSKLSIALREHARAVKQGFTNAVVMSRTPKGWVRHRDSGGEK